MLGVSASAVSRMETGERVLSVEYLEPWSKAVGLRTTIIMRAVPDGVEGGLSVHEGPLTRR